MIRLFLNAGISLIISQTINKISASAEREPKGKEHLINIQNRYYIDVLREYTKTGNVMI